MLRGAGRWLLVTRHWLLITCYLSLVTRHLLRVTGKRKKSMLLAININNTNTMLGLYHNQKWIANWRVSSNRAKLADEYGMLLKNLFDYDSYKMLTQPVGSDLRSLILQ